MASYVQVTTVNYKAFRFIGTNMMVKVTPSLGVATITLEGDDRIEEYRNSEGYTKIHRSPEFSIINYDGYTRTVIFKFQDISILSI